MKLKILLLIVCAIIIFQSSSVIASEDFKYDTTNIVVENKIDDTANDWAKSSISEAIDKKLIPMELQSAYTQKITIKEFCCLAIQTYISKTGNETEQSKPKNLLTRHFLPNGQ